MVYPLSMYLALSDACTKIIGQGMGIINDVQNHINVNRKGVDRK